jgi:RimJ/RimL family protein N-acetyltransferase
MSKRPTLQTKRLTMRLFQLTDADNVRRLAGAKEIASTTLNIPHPYEDGMAQKWIESTQKAFERNEMINFAIVEQETNKLSGAIGLNLNLRHNRAEMGYWIGVPFWGKGYCTEAASEVIDYGFKILNLHRIYASHFTRNPGSGRVMQKIGMTYEGCQRQHVKKWDRFEDRALYGILINEYQSNL